MRGVAYQGRRCQAIGLIACAGPTVDLVATGHRRGLRVSQAPSLGPPAVKSVEMRDGGARGRRLRLSMQEVR